MNYILDTHTFLWAIGDEDELSETTKEIIEDTDNTLYLSKASLWEMSIKISIGKLALEEDFEIIIPREIYDFGIELVSIEIDHLTLLSNLALHHKDPFDRLIIAQAIVDDIPILTKDSKFELYSEAEIIW